MPSVLARIQNYGKPLTPGEDKIAAYIHSHPEVVIEKTINDVAKIIGVSVASVSRFANTLGFRDWKELRLSLAKDSSEKTNPVFSEITSEDSDDVVIEKVFNTNIRSIQDTFRLLNADNIRRVVAAIKKADRIVFFGSGGSGYQARDEAIRFSHLELSAEAYTETFMMVLQAARMTRGQLAFGFSNTGRSIPTVTALGEAKKNSALTIGISNFRNTPLEEVSDIYFCTSLPKRGEMTASLTPRIAVMSIMDAIYVLAAHHGRIAAKVSYLDNLLESKVRFPAGGSGQSTNRS